MSSIFDYLEPIKTVVLETGMIRWAIRRTLAVHHLGGLCMWSGRAGMGKTTAAQHMVKLIEEAYDPNNPRAFRTTHYEVGSFKNWSKHEVKHGIRSLYHGVGCKLDQGMYRGYLPEELAAKLVHFLKKMDIQMIFVDEAGSLSLDAIRGIVLVSDTARLMGVTLTIVLIGMDNLPTKLTISPQVERRVHEWCYFKPCTIEETHKLLAALHPYFVSLDRKDKSHLEQIRYIHEACKGMPGSIVPFATRFGNMFEEFPSENPMVHIKAAHIQPLFDKKRCINDCQSNYSGELKESDQETDTNETFSEKEPDRSADVLDNVVKFPVGQNIVEE